MQVLSWVRMEDAEHSFVSFHQLSA